VSWVAFAPLASATQISNSPDRFELNTTRLPSGEKLGMLSVRVEEIAAAGGETAGLPGADVSTRQMFVSVKL